MTTNNHPITPPLELVQQWMTEDAPWDNDSFGVLTARPSQLRHLATQAARWGADQELEACCHWLGDRQLKYLVCDLRATRRPEPPSLKELALEALAKIEDNKATYLDSSVIRRALEALDD